MAQDLNTVALVGNLTKDVELRYTPAGTPVTELRIAVGDRVKRGEQWQDATYYFSVTAWGRMAENCAQYLSKGKKVGVTGKLTWREWEAQDGSKRQTVEITANSVQFLSPQSQGGGGGHDQAPPPDAQPVGSGGYGTPEAQSDFPPQSSQDDDIPF